MEKKLHQEIKVLETRLAEIEANIAKQKTKVRKAHEENAQDFVTKKLLFGQLKSFKKQTARFSRLHQICSGMLEHVQEQNMMSETSTVLQEFVTVHESLIKESNLDKMVTQFQELSGNVEDMRSDLGYIGEALAGGAEEDEDDLERELDAFLKEKDPSPEPEMRRPQTQKIEEDGNVVIGMPKISDLPSVQSYFEVENLGESKKKENLIAE